MQPTTEQHLLDLISHDTGDFNTQSQFSRFSIPKRIESTFSILVGGRLSDSNRQTTSPDITIDRPGIGPLCIEVSTINHSSLPKNTQNRTANLLATSVQIRRNFPDNVPLVAVLFPIPYDQDRSWTPLELTSSPLISLVSRILREDDGVGYDSVVVGIASDTMKWVHYSSKADINRPFIPISTDELLAYLNSQRASTKRISPPKPIDRDSRFLLVSDEWTSGNGGLSTINRQLAIALAKIGIDTTVMVPTATDEDRTSAAKSGVNLVTPPRVPGLSDHEILLLKPVFAQGEDWLPDVIIGHGRALGPYAFAQKSQFFPSARRIHIVHTDAEQLESAKEELGGASRMKSANERRNLENELARSADLAVGIGPLLTTSTRENLIGLGSQPEVESLIPGLDSVYRVDPDQILVRNHVLFIGRADDFHSKGIDIVAESLIEVAGACAEGQNPPVLIIRGVPDESAKEVKEKLDNILEGIVQYNLRPYVDSQESLINDLAQANVLVMPSRHEGFGLAAYEAIACGVPVLISGESGLAQLLRNEGIDTAPSSIVRTRNSREERPIDLWSRAISSVLNNQRSARHQAAALRDALENRFDWTKAAEKLVNDISRSSDRH